MTRSKLIIVSLLVCFWGGPLRAQNLADFVPEADARAIVDNDTVHLEGGAGRLRSPRLFSNFSVEFEFRLLGEGTQAAFGFRSWPGYPGVGSPGYIVSFAQRRDALAPLAQIETTGLNLKLVDQNVTPLEPEVVGDWHRARVDVGWNSVAVSVDGRVVSSAEELDEFTGYLTFSSANGASEFRSFSVSPLPSWKEPFGVGAYRLSDAGIEPPRAARQAKPYYPREPNALGIQGAVRLEVVVGADGSPDDVRVTTSLHPDLDQAAMASARKWRFTPGMKDGTPVPVIVTMEVGFKSTDRAPQ